jgi:bifunctional DNase/RNase
MDRMIEAEIWTIARTDQGNAVLLRPLGSAVSVPIFIGQFEAQSILIGYGDVVIPRPLTHALLLDVIRRTGMTLVRVDVHELRDTTFYARLVLYGREYSERKPLILDARPSDAFALAVRCKCPVFVAERIIDEVGIPVEMLVDSAMGKTREQSGGEAAMSTPMEPHFTGIDTRREVLLAELEGAVAAEEYERAAEIRDILMLLNKEHDKNAF